MVFARFEAMPSPSRMIAFKMGPPPKPPKSPSNDAAIRVFSTFELLEQILLKVPQLQLPGLQRVCSVWKTSIDRTPSLQRRLFILPNLESSSEPTNPGNGSSQKLPADFGINPYLLGEEKVFRWEKDKTYSTFFSVYDQHDLISTMVFDRLASTGPESLWRRMLVSQPPCFRLKICVCYSGLDNDTGEFPTKSIASGFGILGNALALEHIISDEVGITLGQVLPELEKMMQIALRAKSNHRSIEWTIEG